MTATAQAEPSRDFGARSILRNLEEPGRYAPANLFDGKVDTAYCAALGTDGSVLVTLSDDDSKRLAGVTTVDLVTAGNVTLLMFYNGALQRDRTVTGKGTLHVAYPPPKPGVQLSFELEVDPADKTHPACASELTFTGTDGPIALPGLTALVDRTRARDAQLAAATDKGERAKIYVSSFEWVSRNRAKESSTWEADFYTFTVDGTYSAWRNDIDSGIHTRTGEWEIADRGRTLVIDSRRLALKPCGSYTCAGEMFPVPSR